MKKLFVVYTVILSIFSLAAAPQVDITVVSVTPAATFQGTTIYSRDFTLKFSFPIEDKAWVCCDKWGLGYAVSEIDFEFQNLLNSAIKIIWNDAMYIDPSKASHKIMHSGIKFISRDQPMPPTTIPPKSKISDLLIPTDYVTFLNGEWKVYGLIPVNPGTTTTFGVFLPLEINGEIKGYTIYFKMVVNERTTQTTKKASNSTEGSNSTLPGWVGLILVLALMWLIGTMLSNY